MKEAINRRSVWFLAVFLLISISFVRNAISAPDEDQVCDVRADYSLGLEDYQETIRLHSEVVARQPGNALAHYHLGFAQGMVGHRTAEISEYQRAAALGLKNWDLFLNLGLAELETGDLDGANTSLQQAVLLGPKHPESHYNLAMVDQRRGMLPDAEREILASLRLDPGQPDARNLLGVIYAQQGKVVRALLIWNDLLRANPEYQPARANLALLGVHNKPEADGMTAVKLHTMIQARTSPP
jgi:protein O-GlcNAc transferase